MTADRVKRAKALMIGDRGLGSILLGKVMCYCGHRIDCVRSSAPCIQCSGTRRFGDRRNPK